MNFRSVAEMLHLPIPEVCVCGQVIPLSAIYYAFPLSDDADEPMAFINEWHDHCLGEWGFERDNSEFGIAHTHYASAGSYPEHLA